MLITDEALTRPETTGLPAITADDWRRLVIAWSRPCEDHPNHPFLNGPAAASFAAGAPADIDLLAEIDGLVRQEGSVPGFDAGQPIRMFAEQIRRASS